VRCRHCGFENGTGARFCANCGRPLVQDAAAYGAAPLAAAETRRIITALFADLAGSTALTERLDPEDARAVVGKFYDTVREAVERYDGTVANLLGDAVLAVFGLPTSHEDDPERAVRAALALRDAMAGLNAHLEAEHDLRLEVRVGVNTGEVVAASGSTFDRDFLIADAVTTAARLQQTVGPGTVAVGDRTHRLTRGVIEYRTLPPLEVKGKVEPLRVWEALAPAAAHAEGTRPASPLVGRRAELTLLQQIYARTCLDGIVHVATIVGQPGVGKSRLVREFLDSLRDISPTPLVLRGRSGVIGGQIGYPALLDILKAQGNLRDTDPPDVVREKMADWLRRSLLDDDRLLDGLLLTFGSANGGDGDPGRTRERLFESWRALLADLAAGQPVIAVFEDAHWADDGLLDLIQSMQRGLEKTPLLLVCLGRSELLERRPAWGGRNTVTIDLSPLRAEETQELIAALAQDRLSPLVLQEVARRAEGNPLFAEELVQMLAERPAAGAAETVVIPDSVQAVLTARIDRLPPDERRTLQAAAVVGRTFWPSAVAKLSGTQVAEATRVIEALAARELVVSQPRSTIADEPEYAFRHILTRDVAYGMLPRAQRQRAHAEAARWLEGCMADHLEDVIEIVAEHVRQAGDHARAAGLLHRAANKARRLYANADAIRFFDQALEAAAKGQTPHAAPQLYLGRGEVHQLLGAYPTALADFEAGLAAARQAGDRSLVAALENRVGFIHHRQARLDEAESHFARAAEIARELEDRRTLGLSLIDLATVRWDRGDLAAVTRILAEGTELLRGEGDHSSLARALNLRCMAFLAAGDGGPAIAAAEEALDIARRAGDKSREATSLSYLAVVHNWLGHPRRGLEYARAAAALAESIGDRRRVTYAQEFMVQALMDLGEWGEGIRLTLAFLPEAHRVTPLELIFCYAFLGLMYYEIGDLPRAREALQQAATLETPSTGWGMFTDLAALYLAKADEDAAATAATLDALLALKPGSFAPNETYLLLPVSDALDASGRVDDLRGFIARTRPAVARLDTPLAKGALAIAEARVALHEGRSADAEALLGTAVEYGEGSEHMLLTRHALEQRWRHFGRLEDREALARLYERVAAGLPDDLREIFQASPRVVAIREGARAS
jgi:class 3 adenylate cyclase/tetratricopeptide (TPR) repeat protein